MQVSRLTSPLFKLFPARARVTTTLFSNRKQQNSILQLVIWLEVSQDNKTYYSRNKPVKAVMQW